VEEAKKSDPGREQELGQSCRPGTTSNTYEGRTYRVVRCSMAKKKLPLFETNPYLEDPTERRYWIQTTVFSSAAIEGVRFSRKEVERLLDETIPVRKRVPE
jgi:hypothetical protein